MNEFRLDVADLLHHPGSRRAVHLAAPLPGLAVLGSAVPDEEPIQVDALLERVHEGIVVRGMARTRWSGACSRCLRPVSGELTAEINELYEPDPLEGETYPLGNEQLDLGLAVRDALLLDLPTAPLCRPDCAGLCPVCGIDRNDDRCSCEESVPDPRWAALSQLEL
jgi:DUF177 domain-containing protein